MLSNVCAELKAMPEWEELPEWLTMKIEEAFGKPLRWNICYEFKLAGSKAKRKNNVRPTQLVFRCVL